MTLGIHHRKVLGPISTKSMATFLFILLCQSAALGQKPPITDIAFAPDGNSIVCCSQSGLQVLKWPDLTSMKQVDVSFDNLHCVIFSPDGKTFAVGGGYPSEQGIVEIFSWPECKPQTHFSAHDDSVVSLTWQGNRYLTSGSLDRVLKRWDLLTAKPVRNYEGHSRGVRSARVLATGELVTAGNDHSVRVWDVDTGELIRTMNQHSKPIYCISVCPGSLGRPLIATAAGDRTIRFWQPTIGRMMRYIRLESEPLDLCWINDTRLVASCADGQLRVIDSENVKVRQTIPVLKGWAYAVAAHPKDETIAIAGSNGQIRRVQVKR
jgi:WD40 repeat protein